MEIEVSLVAGGGRWIWSFPGTDVELADDFVSARFPAHLHPEWPGGPVPFRGDVCAEVAPKMRDRLLEITHDNWSWDALLFVVDDEYTWASSTPKILGRDPLRPQVDTWFDRLADVLPYTSNLLIIAAADVEAAMTAWFEQEGDIVMDAAGWCPLPPACQDASPDERIAFCVAALREHLNGPQGEAILGDKEELAIVVCHEDVGESKWDGVLDRDGLREQRA